MLWAMDFGRFRRGWVEICQKPPTICSKLHLLDVDFLLAFEKRVQKKNSIKAKELNNNFFWNISPQIGA